MKTIKKLALLFLIIAGYYPNLNAQLFIDSIRFGRDKSVPALVILSKGQRIELETKIKELTKTGRAKEAVKQVLFLDRESTVELQNENVDFNGNSHVSFSQYHKGLRVEHTRSIVHYKGDTLKSVNGNFRTIGDLSVNPRLSKSEALQYALSHIGAKKYAWEDTETEQLREEPLSSVYPQGELVFYFNRKDLPVLAYKYKIYATEPFSGTVVYVNALHGEIEGEEALIWNVSGTAATRYSGTQTIETQSVSGGYRLYDTSRGNIVTYNGIGQSHPNVYLTSVDYIDNDNNWTAAEWNNTHKDNAALDAHWGAIKTYDYFKNKHNRNSYDGQNSPVINYVNFPDNNAGWDNNFKKVVYGNMNGNPLTSLDIVAHEITHGLTQATAGLLYANESGALNEGFSDIFAACIENTYKPHATNNWLCGEEIVSGGLRSMSNPQSKNHPGTYKGANWYPSVTNPNGYNDYGGVHTNSGVLNYWFYLLANGSSGTSINGVTIQGIGIEKAAKIAYATLVNYLTPASDYYDVAEKSAWAALDLYCSDEASAVSNAWRAVNVCYISGPSSVDGNTTFYITNKPSSATVTWSSSSNLSRSGSNGTTSNGAVFSSIGCGSGWIGATVQINGISYVLPKKNVGVASPAIFSGTYTQAGSTRTLSSLNYVGYTGGAVTVTFPALSGVTYSWAGAITGTGNTKTYTPASTQGFSITVTQTVSGCSTQSATYTFSVTYDTGGCITLYNPNTGMAEINFDQFTGLQELKQTYLVRLIDIYGRTVKESRSQGNTVEWNITSLQNSIYFIRIYNQNNHIVKTEKIIKR